MHYLGYDLDWKIACHLLAAVGALLLGVVILTTPKGTARHKIMGRIWVGLVTYLSFGAFWIHTLNPHGFMGQSVAHITSVLTLLFLALGFWAIKTSRVKLHVFCMKFVFYAGLLLAGSMTLMPGRLLSFFFFMGPIR